MCIFVCFVCFVFSKREESAGTPNYYTTYMESFTEINSDRLFEISVGDKERGFLKDGDKTQNCAKFQKA